MNTAIVDTDVVSFLFKGDTRARLYHPHLQGRTLAVSFMTVAELYQWAYVRNWGAKQLAGLERHLRDYVVVPFDHGLCQQWARISVNRQRLGRVISVQDAWIAATAVQHRCPLVTHNGADFEDIASLTVIFES